MSSGEARERRQRPRASRASARKGFGLMCAFVVFTFCGVLAGTGAGVESTPASKVSSRSFSGQFMVYSATMPALPTHLSDLLTNPDYTRLDATLLPVSCERIKQLLWRELGATAPWQGRISLVLRPAQSADDYITVTSERFRDGWQYRMEVPNVVQRLRYVRGLVQVLLLEMANRSSGTHAAEIPEWLVEGLTQQVLACSAKDEIILPSPRAGSSGLRLASTYVNARMENPLKEAHNRLLAAEPLNFKQLSWPGPEQFVGDAAELYRSSAQLFVCQLLELKNGPACLRGMLAALPRFYNWQFAFLEGFSAHFKRPLDIEKWWTLQVLHFTNRDLSHAWPVEESWEKLDEVVRSAVEVRLGTNELPLRFEVSLQTMIREWEPPRQTQALQLKASELEQARLRMATNLVWLADDYYRTLQQYLYDRGHAGTFLPFGKKSHLRKMNEAAISRLDALDARKAALRSRPQAVPIAPGWAVTQTNQPPNVLPANTAALLHGHPSPPN
jgi:hypothetical protein